MDGIVGIVGMVVSGFGRIVSRFGIVSIDVLTVAACAGARYACATACLFRICEGGCDARGRLRAAWQTACSTDRAPAS